MSSFNDYPSQNHYTPSAPPFPDPLSFPPRPAQPAFPPPTTSASPRSSRQEPIPRSSEASRPSIATGAGPSTRGASGGPLERVPEVPLRTVRLLMFLFKRGSSSKIGPSEFAALWSCLGHWRAIFERFDRDRSGEIDSSELRDALLSLGYVVPPSVLQLLISKYDEGGRRRAALNFDSFVECGMIVKGLTEKFKEKDTRYTGSATLTYDAFLLMIIPFLVA